MKCSIQDCAGEPRFTCSCQEGGLVFCPEHLKSHLLELGAHKPIKNFLEVGEETAMMLCTIFESLSSKIKEVKANMIKNSNNFIKRIISKTNQSLEELKNLDYNIQKGIEFLRTEKVIKKGGNMSQGEKFVLEFIEDDERVQVKKVEIEKKVDIMSNFICHEEIYRNCKDNLDRISEEHEKLKEEYASMKQRIEDLEQYEFIKDYINEPIIKDLDPKRHNLNKIFYFTTNTKELVTVNTMENEDSKFIYNDLSDNMCYYGGVCNIDEENIFYYGGHNGGAQCSWCYKIDTNNKKSLKLGNRKNIRNQGCCYYNRHIYVFGGYLNQSSHSNEVEKCNLDNINSWTTLAPMPLQNYIISTVLLQSEILVLGYQSATIYYYDITHNLFSSYHLNAFVANFNKFIFLIQGRVYVCDNGKLFESGLFNPRQFTLINQITGVTNSLIIATPVRYKICQTLFWYSPIKIMFIYYFLICGFIDSMQILKKSLNFVQLIQNNLILVYQSI